MKYLQIGFLSITLLFLSYTQIQLATIRHSLKPADPALSIPAHDKQHMVQRAYPDERNSGQAPAEALSTQKSPPSVAEDISDTTEASDRKGVEIVENVVALGLIETSDIETALSTLSILSDAQRQQALQHLVQRINNQEIQFLPPASSH